MLGRALGVPFVIGTDVSAERRELAEQLKLVDVALPADDKALSEIKRLTEGRGCEVAVDCSGVGAARLLALQVRLQTHPQEQACGSTPARLLRQTHAGYSMLCQVAKGAGG